MKKIIVGLSIGLFALTASAWGPREQGALAGLIIGAHVFGQSSSSQVITQPQTVYIQPQPLICGYTVYCGPAQCWSEPIYDQWGRIIAERRVCR